MQVYGGSPLRIVFLVDIHVIAVALDVRFGRTFNLDPCVAWNDAVFAKSGVIHHDAQLIFARTASRRNRYEQVVLVVADIGDFHIVSFEILLDFGTVVDPVLDESAALDFPAVVDPAASG